MIDLKKLKEEQIRFAKKLVLKDSFSDIRLIGGVDQAFFEDKIISMIVILNYLDLKLIESKFSISKPPISYIAGFLSYREGPAIIEAFSKIENRPDILMIDGNGILHQRGIGLASHIGLLLDIPSIGVAKNLLLGEIRRDKVFVNGKASGVLMQTKEHAKPLYVSPGHKISLKTAETIVKHCQKTTSKLPEPLRMAHKMVNKMKIKIVGNKKI